jgi:hypothetical protein
MFALQADRFVEVAVGEARGGEASRGRRGRSTRTLPIDFAMQ